MFPADFTELLRCPETMQRLLPAGEDLLNQFRRDQEAGKAFFKSGKPVSGPVESALVREDGRVLYAVRDGIPVLIVEEGILLSNPA